MRKDFLTLIVALILWPLPVYACTIFKMTLRGNTLISNNEDWSDPDSKVWFLSPDSVGHGCVFFGFKNGWAQGGMNDQGLFFDGLAGPVKKWHHESSKKDYPGNLCEQVLKEVSTVEAAIPYFKKYNFPSLITGIFILVDITGTTAVIQYSEGRLRIDTHDSPYHASGYRAERANEQLKEMRTLSVEGMTRILRTCRRRDSYPTQYANVYDPRNMIVYVYPSHGSIGSMRFDLKKELAKGNHYYDLSKLSEQVNGPLLTDHKSTRSIPLAANALDYYTGEYKSGSALLHLYRSGSSLLLKTKMVFDGVMPFRIVPVSADRFVARDIALEIRFGRNQAGKIVGLSLKRGAVEHKAIRLPSRTRTVTSP